MVKLAARFADSWATECAYFREMAGRQPTGDEVMRLTRERVQLLEGEAAEAEGIYCSEEWTFRY